MAIAPVSTGETGLAQRGKVALLFGRASSLLDQCQIKYKEANLKNNTFLRIRITLFLQYEHEHEHKRQLGVHAYTTALNKIANTTKTRPIPKGSNHFTA
jgi:hypothetical protein